jgi:DNA-directed RNA polymerase subunit RPC12/RpoP
MATNDKYPCDCGGNFIEDLTNDNKSTPDEIRCQVCGHLSKTAQAYAEHKLTHPEDEADLATKETA